MLACDLVGRGKGGTRQRGNKAKRVQVKGEQGKGGTGKGKTQGEHNFMRLSSRGMLLRLTGTSPPDGNSHGFNKQFQAIASTYKM